MAVQFANGVVIGADSRTTTGSYIVRLPLQLISTTQALVWRPGEQGNRQINPRPRPRILLSFRLGSGHASHRGYRALPSADVCVSRNNKSHLLLPPSRTAGKPLVPLHQFTLPPISSKNYATRTKTTSQQVLLLPAGTKRPVPVFITSQSVVVSSDSLGLLVVGILVFPFPPMAVISPNRRLWVDVCVWLL